MRAFYLSAWEIEFLSALRVLSGEQFEVIEYLVKTMAADQPGPDPLAANVLPLMLRR